MSDIVMGEVEEVSQLDRIERKLDYIVTFVDTLAQVAGPMLPGGGPGIPVKPW